MTDPQIEIVRWIDSSSATDSSWSALDKIPDDVETYGHVDMYHTSVGFIVFEDDTAIIVARDLQDGHPKLRRQVGDSIKIPHCSILQRTPVKAPKSGRS